MNVLNVNHHVLNVLEMKMLSVPNAYQNVTSAKNYFARDAVDFGVRTVKIFAVLHAVGIAKYVLKLFVIKQNQILVILAVLKHALNA
jgi:hypothetical protein